jgi:hypothetical protein
MQLIARVLAGLSMAWPLLGAGPVLAQPTTIAVETHGELPGFGTGEAASWLAARMAEGDFDHWRFIAGDPAAPAPNRIEWNFEVRRYAGGEVRRFFPMAEAQGDMDVHIQGRHHLISAEARLFLDGQYQTVTLAQAAVKGGAGDPDLRDFIITTTQMLDNAWHAIDLTPPEHHQAAP